MPRAIIIVLDSLGIGELPDAEEYGDTGSNTLKHIYENVKNFKLENLESLGLLNINGLNIKTSKKNIIGSYGKMKEASKGKDTITGHWEMMGLRIDKPFPVFKEGFPPKLISLFESKIGLKIIGNIVASGTEIIKQLGEEHIKTGYPIVYTSADSVFQIAAHEDIIKIKRQYEICSIAREILHGEYNVARVIARPFIGEIGNFKRTSRRHDYSINPIGKTLLEYIKESRLKVKCVGKIADIFNKKGITDTVSTISNMDTVDKTILYLKQNFNGIIFSNLVDFDMLYGHRNDTKGYANALINFDKRLPEIMRCMKSDDILYITADHGCDTITKGTDHSREFVPILVYGDNVKKGINLGERETFSDLGKTIADYLNINAKIFGLSFNNKIMRLNSWK